MMIIKSLMRRLIKAIKRVEDWANEEPANQERNLKKPGSLTVMEIISVWDCLNFKENTQAQHLSIVINFEEWVEMPEIKRRIKELFGMDYKNERSLYPYIKTLADCGLLESTDIGGKRKWRKKAVLVKAMPTEENTTEQKKETAKEKSN